MSKCLFCGKELKGLQTKFCSRKHKQKYYNKMKSERIKAEKKALIQSDWGKIDDDYYVTKNGEVWSVIHNKFLKQYTTRCGYKEVVLHKRHQRIHRLVAKAFIPNPDNLPQVNHIDGNKTNNKVENLEWTDSKRNYYHARKHDLCNHGTFLNEQERNQVREMYKSGKYTYNELHNKFNVSETTLWRILQTG